MNPFKTVLYAYLILLSGNTVFSQELENNTTQQSSNLPLLENTVAYANPKNDNILNSFNYNSLSQIDTTHANKNTIAYPPAFKDYRRLAYDTGMYVGATVIAFGILYAMPESATNWDKQAMKENGFAYKWKQNVKAGPVWDEDDWVLNYVTHPYSGAVYYMTARSSGFNIFESFLYSAFMSTFFWEYGIEAFAEIPSKQDLIVTPVIGSAVGECFFYAKKSIIKHDRRVLKSRFLGYTTLFVIDPFNTLLDSFGYKEKQKTQLNVAPIGFDKGTNKTVWGLNFSMQF
ncbi:DUF3943 domain-containing protein [Flavobacterium sp. N3904]|uniref:DUF3943 domain-containing protein n=1 Tax=Flavobacterium sp. N3904 TaxID=2986835 RepID=UPI002225532A|nr:DUF3943 domain-containing protein [Flavobacterium sp. N3904]